MADAAKAFLDAIPVECVSLSLILDSILEAALSSDEYYALLEDRIPRGVASFCLLLLGIIVTCLTRQSCRAKTLRIAAVLIWLFCMRPTPIICFPFSDPELALKILRPIQATLLAFASILIPILQNTLCSMI